MGYEICCAELTGLDLVNNISENQGVGITITISDTFVLPFSWV